MAKRFTIKITRKGTIHGINISEPRIYSVTANSIESAFICLGEQYPRVSFFGKLPSWMLKQYEKNKFYRFHSHSGEDECDDVEIAEEEFTHIPALEACAGCNGDPIDCWQYGTPCAYNYSGNPVPVPTPALT